MSTLEEPRAQTRTRSFSWEDPGATAEAGLKLSGLEYIAAIIEGTLPPPPIARLFGFEIVQAEAGRAIFALQPAEWMGELNWSSQHVDGGGGVDGQASWVDDGVDGQGADEVAGEAFASSGRGAVVLA